MVPRRAGALASADCNDVDWKQASVCKNGAGQGWPATEEKLA